MRMTKSRWDTNKWDPFAAGSSTINSEEPPITKTRICFLSLALLLDFIAICCVASLAAFQSKWEIGVSGLNGFLIFLLFLILALTTFLLLVPLVFDRWDKWATLNRWISVPRSTWIFLITGAFLSLLSAMTITISAFTQPGCKNPDEDDHADKGDGYKDGLGRWCATKKASAVFLWLLLGVWLACLIHYLVLQRRDSSEHSSSLARFKSTGILNNWKAISSDDAVPGTSRFGRKEAEIERRPQMSPKKASFSVLTQNEQEAGYTYGYSEHVDRDDAADDITDGDLGYPARQPVHHFVAPQAGRPSIDPYGAFDGDGMPTATTPKRNAPALSAEMVGRDAGGIGSGSGVISRTMLLASGNATYDDPCTRVRESLAGHSPSPQPPARYNYTTAHY